TLAKTTKRGAPNESREDLRRRVPGHDVRADAAARPDVALLGDDVLPLRVPGHLARAARIGGERSLRLHLPAQAVARPHRSLAQPGRAALLVRDAVRALRRLEPPPAARARPRQLLPAGEDLRRDELPFFFAGCVVTLAITRLAEDISRLYVFDLAGAAVGCLLLIPVLNQIGAINTIFFIAAAGGL